MMLKKILPILIIPLVFGFFAFYFLHISATAAFFLLSFPQFLTGLTILSFGPYLFKKNIKNIRNAELQLIIVCFFEVILITLLFTGEPFSSLIKGYSCDNCEAVGGILGLIIWVTIGTFIYILVNFWAVGVIYVLLSKEFKKELGIMPIQTQEELEQSRWNWGAFLAGWIWALWYGVWWGWAMPIIIFILGFYNLYMPIIGFGIDLIIRVLLAMRGNKILLETKRYSSLDELRKSQKKWIVFGLVIIVFYFLIFFFVRYHYF